MVMGRRVTAHYTFGAGRRCRDSTLDVLSRGLRSDDHDFVDPAVLPIGEEFIDGTM